MSRCVFMNPHVWPLKIFSASEIYEALDAAINGNTNRKFMGQLNVGEYMLEKDTDVGECIKIYAMNGKITEANFYLVPKGEYIRSSRYLSALVYTDGERDSYFEFYLNSESDSPIVDNCAPYVKSETLNKREWIHLLFDLDEMSPIFKEHNDMRKIRCLRCDFANIGGNKNNPVYFENEYAKIKYIGFFRTRELAEDYYNQIMKIKESE